MFLRCPADHTKTPPTFRQRRLLVSVGHHDHHKGNFFPCFRVSVLHNAHAHKGGFLTLDQCIVAFCAHSLCLVCPLFEPVRIRVSALCSVLPPPQPPSVPRSFRLRGLCRVLPFRGRWGLCQSHCCPAYPAHPARKGRRARRLPEAAASLQLQGPLPSIVSKASSVVPRFLLIGARCSTVSSYPLLRCVVNGQMRQALAESFGKACKKQNTAHIAPHPALRATFPRRGKAFARLAHCAGFSARKKGCRTVCAAAFWA